MSSFSYDPDVLERVAEKMLDEAGFGRSGAYFTGEYVASIPTGAGSVLYGDSADAVRRTGEILADLHSSLDRFWTHSSNEITQTLESYQQTDQQAAAEADAMYQEHVQNPVEEEERL